MKKTPVKPVAEVAPFGPAPVVEVTDVALEVRSKADQFWRCGMKFTALVQPVWVSREVADRLRADPDLIVKEA